MNNFKKIATIDDTDIFRGEHNNVRGYYKFEQYRGGGEVWYTIPTFLGHTKNEVRSALSDLLDWNYRAWHGEMAHILEIIDFFNELHLPTTKNIIKGGTV